MLVVIHFGENYMNLKRFLKALLLGVVLFTARPCFALQQGEPAPLDPTPIEQKPNEAQPGLGPIQNPTVPPIKKPVKQKPTSPASPKDAPSNANPQSTPSPPNSSNAPTSASKPSDKTVDNKSTSTTTTHNNDSNTPTTTNSNIKSTAPTTNTVILPSSVPSGVTVNSTITNMADTLACEDFGQVFSRFSRSVVLVGNNSGWKGGALFQNSGMTWLCVPAVVVNGDPNKLIDVHIVSPLANGGIQTSLTGISVGNFKILNVGIPIALLDVSHMRAQLNAAGVEIPLLADTSDAALLRLPGSPCATIWRDAPKTTDPARIAITRVEAIEKNNAAASVIALSPTLEGTTTGFPVFDRTGSIIGLCAATTTADQRVRTAITMKDIDLATKISPGTSTRTTSTNPSVIPTELWTNCKGLEEVIQDLESHNYNQVKHWKIVTMSNGRYIENYVPQANDVGSTVIAVLSEDPNDQLSLTVHTVSGNDGLDGKDSSRMNNFGGAYKHAAVGMEDPSQVVGAICTTTASNDASSAKLLVIECGNDIAANGNLDSLQTLMAKLCEQQKKTDTSSSGRRPDSQSNDKSPPVPIPPLNPSGPLVLIQLHGTVGAIPETSFFTASDFNEALNQAFILKPSCIVLDIKSGGGRVDTKDEIVKRILEVSENGQRIVAAVHDAGSAAALITLACPEILVYPAARIGAAVTILDTDSGVVSFKKYTNNDNDPDLAAKYKSFEDAIDAEAARSTKRSPAIVAAMKELENSLWWSEKDGFTDKKTAPDSQCFDTDLTILTLTYTQVIDTKLGKKVRNQDELWSVLGYPQEPQVIEISKPMRDTYNKIYQLVEEFTKTNDPAINEEIQNLAGKP